MAKSCSSFSLMKRSNTSVASTTVRGTAMRTPGKRRACAWDAAGDGAKASPRALPPSEPSPMRRKNASSGWNVCRIEIANQVLTLFPAVLGDGVNQVASQHLDAGEVRELARPQLLRECKFGPRHQPVRKVVALPA